MKKIVFTLITIISFNLGYAQLNGINFENARVLETDLDSELESNKRILLKDSDGVYFIYYGSPNNVSIQRAIEKSTEICNANGLDFDSPTINKTILHNRVRSIYQYDDLKYSLSLQKSEVDQTYYTPEGNGFKLFMNNQYIMILFFLQN